MRRRSTIFLDRTRWDIVNQTNIGPVSKTKLWKLPRDGVETLSPPSLPTETTTNSNKTSMPEGVGVFRVLTLGSIRKKKAYHFSPGEMRPKKKKERKKGKKDKSR